MSDVSIPNTPYMRAKADRLQDLIEKHQRDKWIAEDRANGIIRVDTRDEATVERVARALFDLRDIPAGFGDWDGDDGPSEMEKDWWRNDARAVLAALHDQSEGGTES